jgi:hypothetical protein
MNLPEGYEEDVRNHFDDGYNFGREDERKRIQILVELDMLLSEEVKSRIRDLINGGRSDD